MTSVATPFLAEEEQIAPVQTGWMDRIGRVALVGIAGAILVCATIRTVVSYMTAADIEHTSGTWIAMAADARDGVLYRPIAAPRAMGGTRYVPLHPLVQALLLKAGMGYTDSGFAIELVSMISILISSYLIMRRLGATALNAVCFTCLILAASGVNSTIGANKADLLAAALSFWGVFAVICIQRDRREVRWGMIAAAGTFFALALMTKITSIFGLSAGVIWLWTQSKKRSALLVVGVWLIEIVAMGIAVEYASGGRALGVFRACAAGGGGLRDLMRGPLMLAANSMAYDKGVGYVWALGVVVMLGMARRQWMSLPVLLFVISTAGTAAIFGTPGINVNHLVDLHLAGVILLATQWHRAKAHWVFAIFLAWVLSIQSAWFIRQASNRWENSNRVAMVQALTDADASPGHGPILSENPLLPLMDGERPYLLDSFMLRVINRSRPELTTGFWKDLEGKKFRAVILSHPPTWNRMFTEWNFGPGFIDRLEESYELKGQVGDFWIFYPKVQNVR